MGLLGNDVLKAEKHISHNTDYLGFYVDKLFFGLGVAKWLTHYATSKRVPKSIPGGVNGNFFRGIGQSHVPGSTQPLIKVSTRILLGVKTAGA
jgi:hypothetical protein